MVGLLDFESTRGMSRKDDAQMSERGERRVTKSPLLLLYRGMMLLLDLLLLLLLLAELLLVMMFGSGSSPCSWIYCCDKVPGLLYGIHEVERLGLEEVLDECGMGFDGARGRCIHPAVARPIIVEVNGFGLVELTGVHG